MIRRRELLEAAIDGLEEQIRQKRATINQLRAELNGTAMPAIVSEPERSPKTEPRKRELAPARREALLRNLIKARAARARKRAARR